MRNIANAAIFSLACVLTLAPCAASAQTTAPPPAPPSNLITYRGLETGFDVTAGRKGEIAFYMGASSTRGSLAVRFSKMDDGLSVPCSVGVMYRVLVRPQPRTHHAGRRRVLRTCVLVRR